MSDRTDAYLRVVNSLRDNANEAILDTVTTAYKNLYLDTSNTTIATSYNKEFILECIKDGLRCGTIDYKDILVAIKESQK